MQEDSGAVEQGGSGAVDPSAETRVGEPVIIDPNKVATAEELSAVFVGGFVVAESKEVRTIAPVPRTTTKMPAIGDTVFAFDEHNWTGPMAAVVTGGPFPRPQDGDVNPQPDGGDGCFVNVSVLVDPARVKLGADPAMAVPVVRHDRLPLYDAGVDPTANTDGELFEYATWRA